MSSRRTPIKERPTLPPNAGGVPPLSGRSQPLISWAKPLFSGLFVVVVGLLGGCDASPSPPSGAFGEGAVSTGGGALLPAPAGLASGDNVSVRGDGASALGDGASALGDGASARGDGPRPGDSPLVGFAAAVDRTWGLLAAPEISSGADRPDAHDDSTPLAPGGGWILFSSSDGEMRGWTGCNRVAAPFEVRGEALSFGPARTTRRGCPDAEWAREEVRLLDALSRTARFSFENGDLEWGDAEGRILLRFRLTGVGQP